MSRANNLCVCVCVCVRLSVCVSVCAMRAHNEFRVSVCSTRARTHTPVVRKDMCGAYQNLQMHM